MPSNDQALIRFTTPSPNSTVPFFYSQPSFTKAIRFEGCVGAIFIVPAPALVALLGGSAASGKSLEVLLASPRMWIVLAVVTVILRLKRFGGRCG